MHGNPPPGEAFHIRHGGTLENIGRVPHVFLQDRKDPRRRIVSRFARTDCGAPNTLAVSIDIKDLIGKACNDDNRPDRCCFRMPCVFPRFQPGRRLHHLMTSGRSRSNGQRCQLEEAKEQGSMEKPADGFHHVNTGSLPELFPLVFKIYFA